MPQVLTLSDLLIAVGGMGALQFLVTLWVSERFNAALARETGKFLESVRWDLKVREQAANVAEYMALARDLRTDTSAEVYRKANRLSWELALSLPADIYRSMAKAIEGPEDETNPLSVLARVRKVLLDKTAGDLTQDQIAHHAPGIGTKALPNATVSSTTDQQGGV